MGTGSYRSRPQVPAANRIIQAGRPVVEVTGLLVGAAILGAVLVGALVWTLRTLGLLLV